MRQITPSSPSGAASIGNFVDPRLPAYQPAAFDDESPLPFSAHSDSSHITGSKHSAFIMEKLAAAFRRHHAVLKLTVDLRGSGTAIPFLIHGKGLVSVLGREASDAERVPYVKGVAAEPFSIRIAHAALCAKDGLATSLGVYVHASNPLERITLWDLARILATGHPDGDMTCWGQAGLSGPWEKRTIHPYCTQEYSGFGTHLQRHLLAGRLLNPISERYTGGAPVLDRIADDPAGIGIAAIGDSRAAIKPLAISLDKKGPFSIGTADEILSGTYPLARFLNLFLRRDGQGNINPRAKAFATFILSREGQEIIASQKDGYLPLTAQQAEQERLKLAA